MGVDAAHSVDAPASDDNIKKNLPASKLRTRHSDKSAADIAPTLPPDRFHVKSTAAASQPNASCTVGTRLDVPVSPPLSSVEETRVYAAASQSDPFCAKGTQNAAASQPDASCTVGTRLDVPVSPPVPSSEEGTRSFAAASPADPLCAEGTRNAAVSQPDASCTAGTRLDVPVSPPVPSCEEGTRSFAAASPADPICAEGT